MLLPPINVSEIEDGLLSGAFAALVANRWHTLKIQYQLSVTILP